MSNIVKAAQTQLRVGLNTDGLVLSVRQFVDNNGEDLTLADFGDFFTVVIKDGSREEVVRCNGITQNANGTAELIVEPGWRNVANKPPYTGGAMGLSFSAGAIVITTNDPFTMSQFLQKDLTDPQTVAGDIRFPNPTNDANAATKAYADGVALASAPPASETNTGVIRLSNSPDTSLGDCTISIASPAVISLSGHGLIANDTIKISTTGALPTGLVADTTYYVRSDSLTVNEFTVSATRDGSAINTTGFQNGTHSITRTTPITPIIGADDNFVTDSEKSSIPSPSQKDALNGTGTPSGTNKYVTKDTLDNSCLLYTSPSPRDRTRSRMPSSA